MIDLYSTETGTEVVPETYAWNDYWQKLATQAAGRNLPDVIQMDYRFIFEYARRQQLAALDDFIGQQIALDDFDPNQLASGKVDGKLYGISMGANSMSYVYNKVLLDKLGIELPDPTTWTNDDFEAIGMQVKDQLPEGMFFVQNMGSGSRGSRPGCASAARRSTPRTAQLGYELADLTDFFAYWKGLQDKGLTPPADIQSQDAERQDGRARCS